VEELFTPKGKSDEFLLSQMLGEMEDEFEFAGKSFSAGEMENPFARNS
jgi:hypothetical protein